MVEVRSEEEILRTLDADGKLDGLPFMPEMLGFCGQRYRVRARAHKACDTIDWQQFRRMESAVHLEELRCDGSAHGGCQAGCLLFWKEAWLRPVEPAGGPSGHAGNGHAAGASKETLIGATQVGTNEAGQTLFSCQATELLRASKGLLPWWEPNQYVKTSPRVIRRYRGSSVRFWSGCSTDSSAQMHAFFRASASSEAASATRSSRVRRRAEAHLRDRLAYNPARSSRSRAEKRSSRRWTRTTNAGTSVRLGDAQVLRTAGASAAPGREDHRREDRTDAHYQARTVILDGVICTGDYHRSCPRAIYPYWREAWLRRVEDRA